MVKFISIPNTLSASNPFLFNVANISFVTYLTATTFAVYANGLVYTFTTSAAGAAGTVNAVNKAILNPAGPILTTVEMPAGVTIAAAPTVGVPSVG
jgi:hypothetical protein